jgi:1-acyl-sn-glycerol-3-phosphate acyltransferase
MMNKFLGWFPAVVFFLVMGLFATPDLYLRRCWNWARRATALEQRCTETAWQFRWARFHRRLIHSLMGISMPIRIDSSIPVGRPCILVVNHRTALDHLCAAEVIQRLGLRHVLWVVKDGMRSAPVLGSSCQRAGYALVSRQKGNLDKTAVREMARLAQEDGASVAIYPEGTRHDGIIRDTSPFRSLRNPKIGGLQVILDVLHEYDVVFVCLHWRGLRGGRTIWDGEGLLGIHGSVTVWGHTRAPGDTAQSILDAGWSRMDRILSPSSNEFSRMIAQA